jgi:hypothetical protein
MSVTTVKARMSATNVQARMSATNADGECLSDYTSFDEYSLSDLVASVWYVYIY